MDNKGVIYCLQFKQIHDKFLLTISGSKIFLLLRPKALPEARF